VAAVANLPQRLEVPPSPSPPIRSFVIYYAFPRLVAALTARGVREQIGIFTSPCRLCSLRPPLSLSLSLLSSGASALAAKLCMCAIVTLPRPRTGSRVYSNFILLPSSESCFTRRAGARAKLSREGGRSGMRRIICLDSVLGRNLARFILKRTA
jgi:hypothetical protein